MAHLLKTSVLNTAVPSGAELFEINRLNQQQQANCLVMITAQDNDLRAYEINAKFLFPNHKVIVIPAWDCMPYDNISPSKAIIQKRIMGLNQLAKAGSEEPLLVIFSASSLLQKLIPVNLAAHLAIELKAGGALQRDQLLQQLTDFGYERRSVATMAGEFAVRGSIIDIISNDDELAGYRIDLFGNEIDKIRVFDPIQQTSSKSISKVVVTPLSEVVLNDDSIATFKRSFRRKYGVNTDSFYESTMARIHSAGIEHHLELFYEDLVNIFNYLPKDAKCYAEQQTLQAVPDQLSIIEDHRKLRQAQPSALISENLYLQDVDLKELPTLTVLSPFQSVEVGDDAYKVVPSFFQEAKLKERTAFDLFKDFATTAVKEGKKVVIACFTNSGLEKLQDAFERYDLQTRKLASLEELNDMPKHLIAFTIWQLEKGFQSPELVVFSEQDLLGPRLSRSGVKRRSSQSPDLLLKQLNTISAGDLVVHVEHGIGLFLGVESIRVSANKVHDFVKLEYRDQDKLYVPVENLELVSKYGENETGVVLDKLGGVNWQKRKAKLKERIKLAAEELMAVAGKRHLVEMEGVHVIDDMYEKFCQGFPYVETEGQLATIADVTRDLAGTKPMDRLVCGDVGFGKTEIALRAAAQMICNYSPKQVAVIVPTTLLARQHFEEFSRRFAGLPVKVSQLSKFVSSTNAKLVKEGLKKGTVDLVIGTHSLLAKDINFARLGMIIIDEEQHFGVAQKERLKSLKAGVHILTLSATPIPRTLQMSLTGVKELSILASPPLDRLPIKTYVTRVDPIVIRDAVLREKFREGRVFYVSPRIEYLKSIFEDLKENVPEARVVMAHGQMTAAQLDKIMCDFYDGKFDVLLATTIVESGLDIPSANTLIVDRAHMFGLAQLYQIRGRVGRSREQAYAYLTLPTEKMFTGKVKKRLEVLQNMNTLGSGFTIATQDMEIRGYGNLVGEEQSGHIKEVGVELYQSMLKDAVDNITQNQLDATDGEWSPTLNVGVAVQIPSSYIADDDLRLMTYRRIANADEMEKAAELRSELIDRFGNVPKEVENLFDVCYLKQVAKDKNISKVECGDRALIITFRNEAPANVERVIDFISSSHGKAKLKGEGKLLIFDVGVNEATRLSEIKNVISKL
jgi:transcription-repair coupling factor (superfamily II helicase)